MFYFVLGYSQLLEKAMAPHFSTLARKIPWTEEPGKLPSMGSQRVGHDWATSLPTWQHHFTFPKAVNEDTDFSMFLPILVIILFIRANLMSVKQYLTVVLICIPLMTNDGKHFFRCFLATCLYSLEETVFKSFACCFFFLKLLSFILHILLIQLPYHISNMQMLFPILWVVFLLILFWQCSLKHKSSLFWLSLIYVSCSVACAFDVLFKNSLPNPRSWRFILALRGLQF